MELTRVDITQRNHRRPARLLVSILAVLALVVGGLTVTAGPAAAATRMATFDSQMITLVNQARVARGLPKLQEARGLTSLSVWWSNEMAIGHTGYQLQHNANAWDMLPRYGASNRTSWGENVAKYSPSNSLAKDIFNAYMASPGHRANILGSGYRYIGMGTMAGAGGLTFNTMTFTDRVESGQIVATVAITPKVRGTFRAANYYTRKPISNVRYSIRKGDCDPVRQVYLNSTTSTGAFSMLLTPGLYCGIPVSWPSTYSKPGRVVFRVYANKFYLATAWMRHL